MSSNVTFQTQLTTIMGILCDSALVEISKLVDEGSAMLRLEVSQSHGENEALRRKLKLMESELKTARGHQKGRDAARGGSFACRSVGVQTGDETRAADGGVLEEPCPTIDSVFGKEWCLSLWRDGQSVEEDDSMMHCGTMVDEFTERPSSPLVKDEKDQKSDHGERNAKTIPAVGEQNLKTIPAVGEQNLKTTSAVGEQNLKTIPAVGEQNLKTIPAVGEQNLKTIPAVGEQNLKTIPAVGEQNLKTIPAVGQEEQDIMQITPPESITESNSDAENSSAHLAGTSVNTEKHTDVHKNITGGKRLLCSLCGKSFEYLSYLKIHLRSHSGEKPFSCTVCGKSFAQKTYLTLHWRTHTGEKPYSCVECGKCFSQKSSLNSHLRSHTGEKPYSCTLCGKSYAYKHGLNLHHCVHSGRNDIISVSLDSD